MNERVYGWPGAGWHGRESVVPTPKDHLGYLKRAVSEHPGLVVLGVIVAATVADGLSPSMYLPNNPVVSADEQNSSLPPQSHDFMVNADRTPTTGKYIKIAEDLLEMRGLDMNEFSFRDRMSKEGYLVQEMETFGTQARMAVAGKDGVRIRRAPSLDPKYATDKTVEAGREIPYIASVRVRNLKDNTAVKYGLMTNPYAVEVIYNGKGEPISEAPNFIRFDENRTVRIVPAYVWLGEEQIDRASQGLANRHTGN